MIDLFVIAFLRPDLLRQQKRLLDKYLRDDYQLCCVDNTPQPGAYLMEETCSMLGIGYMHSPSEKNLHNEALNYAALHVTSEYFGFLDHDVFPTCETTLIDKLDERGFYGIGQRHAPTGHRYLWPGFCFFSRKWLGTRSLNFDGIRGEQKREDGDCGSMNWPLFTEEDWEKMFGMEHGYRAVREPDSFGLQSWGYEIMGSWIHFTNASGWMPVPQKEERDRLLLNVLETL